MDHDQGLTPAPASVWTTMCCTCTLLTLLCTMHIANTAHCTQNGTGQLGTAVQRAITAHTQPAGHFLQLGIKCNSSQGVQGEPPSRWQSCEMLQARSQKMYRTCAPFTIYQGIVRCRTDAGPLIVSRTSDSEVQDWCRTSDSEVQDWCRTADSEVQDC